MNRENYFRMMAHAETWSERFLTFIIGLPPPWTAVVTIGLLVLATVGVNAII